MSSVVAVRDTFKTSYKFFCFLLTANLDALFDRFLISFDINGKVLMADSISENDREFLGLHSGIKLRWITQEHKTYLAQHRLRLKPHETPNNQAD